MYISTTSCSDLKPLSFKSLSALLEELTNYSDCLVIKPGKETDTNTIQYLLFKRDKYM